MPPTLSTRLTSDSRTCLVCGIVARLRPTFRLIEHYDNAIASNHDRGFGRDPLGESPSLSSNTSFVIIRLVRLEDALTVTTLQGPSVACPFVHEDSPKR